MRKIPGSLLTMTTKSLLSGVSLASMRMTPAERAAGRFLRAPDHDAGTGGGDAGAAGADAGAGDGAAAGADAGQGGEGSGGGEGAQGAADTILGGAAAEGGEGDGDGQAGEGAAAAAGEGEGEEEGEQGGDQAAQVMGAPEAYDLKLSDELTAAGVTFDKEAFDAVEPVLRELDLSNDAAQKIVGAYAEKVLPLLEKRAGERADAMGVNMRKEWETQAKADPEIGGAKFDETKALARQTFVRFGVKSDGPFLKLMEESGLGNHPDMLRFVANVGRLTGEANVDVGGGGKAPERLADRVYGKPTPRE